MKNTTLLLKFHEKGKPGRPVFQAITPLFQIKAFRINLNQSLKQITNNPMLTYSPLKKQFDRILILGTQQQTSNARRSVAINNKRNDLIHFINKQGQKSYMYLLHLCQINQFVPTQLQTVFNQQNNPNKIKSQIKKNYNVVSFRYSVLFPFNYQQWKILLKSSFPKYDKINYFKLQQNYFFMQICNLYMIQYALNQKLMYQDMRDFDAFLGKFNFIRYFWQVCASNQFTARKYSERLIKNIKWRTKQSQQYLLMLIRANNWERFILMVQDFVLCYQQIYGKVQNKQQVNKNI